MGFYIRKSVRVGPLRFNLSKSGIGISAGIPGFRVGMGPRGNYIHAGRGGFYYRTTLPSSGGGRPPAPPSAYPAHAPVPSRPTVGPQEEIESGSVLQMRDESADGLLKELNDKKGLFRFGPAALVGSVAGAVWLWPRAGTVGQVTIAILALAIVVAAFVCDALRKTTVIMYDMEPDAVASYQALIDAVKEFGRTSRLWHISSRAEVLDRKYHAGAQQAIKRTPTSTTLGSPPFVKCNVDVPSIEVGKQKLFFLPDRLLVFDAGSVGAVSYSALIVDQGRTQFVEDDGVPSDSRVVGRTWRYVNKSGGPDRRFKDNSEIPICEYETIHLRSATGLNELLHASRVGVASALSKYLVLEGARLGQGVQGQSAGPRQPSIR
jgi:hypothetical protein